jgi:hypothetical protein
VSAKLATTHQELLFSFPPAKIETFKRAAPD